VKENHVKAMDEAITQQGLSFQRQAKVKDFDPEAKAMARLMLL